MTKTPPISLKYRYEILIDTRITLIRANESMREAMVADNLPRPNLSEVYLANALEIQSSTAILQELWREYGEEILP